MFDQQSNQAFSQSASGGGDVIFWYVVLGLIVAAAIFFLWRRQKAHRRALLNRSLDSVFLKISVPRESSEDKFSQEATKKDEKELIGIAQQLFTTLSFPAISWWEKFWYGQDILSFEIAAIEKKIHFYIVAPRRMAEVVERQIHAQYPKAVIEEVDNYRLFRPDSHVAAAEMGLQKKFIYPIKTYDKQNSDPLNAITNAMSKLTTEESMALQLVLTPAEKDWGNLPRHIAEEIQQGKRPKDVDVSTWKKVGSQFGKSFSDSLKGTVQSEEQKAKQKNKEDRPITLTPMQQDLVKGLEEKASQTGYLANIRLIVASESMPLAESHLSALTSSFTQYSHTPLNGFKVLHKNVKRITRDFVLRLYQPRKFILNSQELASLWHLPTKFTETPNIAWVEAKVAPAPVNMPAEGLLLGKNVYRKVQTEVHIADEDRRRHVYIIGGTGTGKTEMMKFMAGQDIIGGRGICIIDPHGDFVEDILTVIPKNRIDDVILFDPSDMERPFGLNMLEVNYEGQIDLAVAEMLSIFFKLFPPEMLGPIFEHNMRNVLLTLAADVEEPGTIAEVPRMFTDNDFQKHYTDKVKDPTVRSFWEQEMAKTSDFHKSEMLGYLISKVGRFVENTMMRNIIGQKHSSFDFREVMDEGKILLVNLSKGKIGELNAKLLGLIIVSKLQMAALSRAGVAESQRKDFYLYVDEFQNFITDSFAIILSEARKYKLNLTMAHQYLNQLTTTSAGSSTPDTTVRDAVFGNVGTKIVFRVGVEDAEIIARELSPVFNEFDVTNIPKYNAYVKLLIENAASRPFSMQTIPMERTNDAETVAGIKELSRLKYGRPRQQVEEDILDRSQLDKMNLKPADIIEASGAGK